MSQELDRREPSIPGRSIPRRRADAPSDLRAGSAAVLRFVTTADTEILATAGAVERLPDDFPEVRCANPGAATDHAAFVEDVLDGRARRALPRARRPARLARGLRPAARALRRARHRAARARRRGAARRRDDGALARARRRGRAGRRVPPPRRHRQRRAVAALPRRHVPARGLRLRAAARGARSRRVPARAPATCRWRSALAGHDAGRPTVGVCFYRSHRLTGNTAFVDALCGAIEAAGGNAVAVWSYTLRRDADGRVPALELLAGHVDALIVTMLATGGSSAGDAVVAEGGDGVGEAWQEWDASRALRPRRAGHPGGLRDRLARGLAGVRLRASRRSTPRRRSRSPSSTGGCSAASISFKERDADGSRVGVAVPHYAPDLERCSRVAAAGRAHGPAAHAAGRASAASPCCSRASRRSTPRSAWRSASTRPRAR